MSNHDDLCSSCKHTFFDHGYGTRGCDHRNHGAAQECSCMEFEARAEDLQRDATAAKQQSDQLAEELLTLMRFIASSEFWYTLRVGSRTAKLLRPPLLRAAERLVQLGHGDTRVCGWSVQEWSFTPKELIAELQELK